MSDLAAKGGGSDADEDGPGEGLILVAGPVEAATLAELHASAFHAPWSAEALTDLLIQPGVFAVRNADGFILCRTVLDEAEILTLAVRPVARKRGLGRRLVEAAAGLAREAGATRLFLEVADDNAAARALYGRAGFAQVGGRRGYYARADGLALDALLLSLNLA